MCLVYWSNGGGTKQELKIEFSIDLKLLMESFPVTGQVLLWLYVFLVFHK